MIRVLIVDEVRLVCDVLAADLQDEPDLQVVGVATTAQDALDLASRSSVMLLSSTLPANGALELTRTVSRLYPNVKVLIIGLGGAKDTILSYIESGAAGYVLQEDSLQELLTRIRAAHVGQALVSPDIVAALMSRISELSVSYSGPEDDLDGAANLTSREREVVDLIAQGFTNREIAERLTIEVGTVKNHVHNVLRKLNVNSRRDVVSRLTDMDTDPANVPQI